jgi:uncharacterized OsmC-like protein
MEHVEVRHEGGDRYRIRIRGHDLVVDQPDTGDAGPTPTELFVASLASCVGFYAGRFCARHGIDPAGLAVETDWVFAEDRPARVARIDVRLVLPLGFPDDKRERMHAVVDHCTVHNSIAQAPEIAIELQTPAPV